MSMNEHAAEKAHLEALDAENEDTVLSPEEHARRWWEWVRNGPHGPIVLDDEATLPDEG